MGNFCGDNNNYWQMWGAEAKTNPGDNLPLCMFCWFSPRSTPSEGVGSSSGGRLGEAREAPSRFK